MRVYRLRFDVNNYQYFLPEREEDWPTLYMDCSPRSNNWKPIPVYIYQPKLKRGNFYSYTSGALITDPYATNILRTHFEKAGELLSLPYEEEVFTVLNVTECINCLDQDRTEWVYGKTTGERIKIKSYQFHLDRFSEFNIFKIPETCKAEILVVEGLKNPEDEFKYEVKSSGLQGLIFDMIWEG